MKMCSGLMPSIGVAPCTGNVTLCSIARPPGSVGGVSPRRRADDVAALTERARSLLVLGSSLTVMSGLRFVRHATEHDIPTVIINHGSTRGDDHARIRLDAPLGTTLTGLVTSLP